MSGHPCSLYVSKELLSSIEASFAELPDLDIPDVPECLLESLSGDVTAVDMGPVEQSDSQNPAAVSKGQQHMAKILSPASPLMGHGEGTATEIDMDVQRHPACVKGFAGNLALTRDDSSSTAFEALIVGSTQPVGEAYPFEDTWLMKTAGDLPVHNQKYLPPASAGHAGASTPQEFIHCSPIVSAFVGSFFDPGCRGMDHLSMLAQLAPADRRTARMLMRNFSSNLQVRVPVPHRQR
ncbi:hypothetical protein CVIRNUC_010244 [Coccomyxa viridis]|uniref:Uncharacterized protein n=1 Tax=Coccomyxa viridis TaxID=1274662 RepID=A0AAV1IIB8_9CHLO|nr:hypothetical protein CVIRNUC_010244 [Coccomyxa viridis]